MKDAKKYEKKIKKLLGGAKKKAASKAESPEPQDWPKILIESILLAEATEKDVARAMAAFRKEYVDFNELRAAQPKEIIECIGDDYPDVTDKALSLIGVLGGIFTRVSTVSMEYIAEMSKRDIRRHLRELGLGPFAEAMVSIQCFGIHAIPVDDNLFETLQMNEMVHPASHAADTQSFLERIIAQKNGLASHEFFRDYVVKNIKALTKIRKEAAVKKAAEEAAAKKAAEEAAAKKAAEEAAAKKAAEEAAARKAAEEKEAAKKAKAEARAKKAKKAKKKTVKKAAKKVVKKAAKPAAKKTAKKVAKKTVKKAASKAVKKTVKKAAKKTVKKPVKKVAKKTAKTKKVAKKTAKKKK